MNPPLPPLFPTIPVSHHGGYRWPLWQVLKINPEERLVAIKLTTLPPGVLPTPKVEPKPVAPEPQAAAEPTTEA